MKLPDSVIQDYTKHVLAEYPKESCGLVVNDAYVPCVNIHEEPTKHFRIAPEQMVLEQSKGKLQAVLHSHPYKSSDVQTDGYRPEYPSASDIDHFNQSGVPWGIASTDGGGLSELVWLDDSERPPIYGRLFIWGTQDCFSLVRDWFMLNRAVNLYNPPREWGWWNQKDAEHFIESLMEKMNFRVIPSTEATIGDVALMRMGDRHTLSVINHCGVITDHNELTHQGCDPFYSRACRMDLWQMSIAKFVRYEG